MAGLWKRLNGRQSYSTLPLNDDDSQSVAPFKTRRPRQLAAPISIVCFLLITGFVALYVLFSFAAPSPAKSCDSIDEGYRCSPEISQFWGQYSLWFSVLSEIDVNPPKDCSITFAQVLSRHGGRDPTVNKRDSYRNLIAKIQLHATAYIEEYEFLETYRFNMGADQLTDIGRQQMVNSGIQFHRRYKSLISKHQPFVRASGQDRVVESAEKWLNGLAEAANQKSPSAIDLIIPEAADTNNTMSHGICKAFEDGPKPGVVASEAWAASFISPIAERVNSHLPGAELTNDEVIYLMDLCPFDTVAAPTGRISPFCQLFSEKEWHQYDYYRSLEKYYNYMNNPLAPTQGVGYVNELLARLTETPVKDGTTTNHTLDSDPKTFPIDRKVYADFSHDNDMSLIFAALGLYNTTKPLLNNTMLDTKDTNGYSAAWTVPFAARAYFEKMQCKGEKEEYVRVIVNDRVLPLEFCGADKHFRCKLSKFVESQAFARSGGHWDQCHIA
ncbi:acid phosphatase [Delitschia confertaspora ATCC 74209]|uniref:Phytase A n=1 Tax=Delitschia confertaspora ATCC 74209 TaxID=1513339 RepID=A0A9P4JHY5_9PLEO|nr:acid phosphatase [Delitschia confertaspora ATCC 74209]